MKLFNHLFAYPGQHFSIIQSIAWSLGLPVLVAYLVHQLVLIIERG